MAYFAANILMQYVPKSHGDVLWMFFVFLFSHLRFDFAVPKHGFIKYINVDNFVLSTGSVLKRHNFKMVFAVAT